MNHWVATIKAAKDIVIKVASKDRLAEKPLNPRAQWKIIKELKGLTEERYKQREAKYTDETYFYQALSTGMESMQKPPYISFKS